MKKNIEENGMRKGIEIKGRKMEKEWRMKRVEIKKLEVEKNIEKIKMRNRVEEIGRWMKIKLKRNVGVGMKRREGNEVFKIEWKREKRIWEVGRVLGEGLGELKKDIIKNIIGLIIIIGKEVEIGINKRKIKIREMMEKIRRIKKRIDGLVIMKVIVGREEEFEKIEGD